VDRGAREQAREAQLAAETYAVETNGTYQGLTLAKLQSLKPILRVQAAAKLGVVAGSDSYSVSATSHASRITYIITREPNGAVKRICIPAGHGECPADGQWGGLGR
jgi:hypothetical protein